MKAIRVGDSVSWRGNWGTQPAKLAKVIHIEKTQNPRQKYGYTVNEISLNEKYCAVFSLDNGHWAYGDQIEHIEDSPEVL